MLGQRIEVRFDGVGEIVAVGGVPANRPRHRAANAGIGRGRLEGAAVGTVGQAVERGIDY